MRKYLVLLFILFICPNVWGDDTSTATSTTTHTATATATATETHTRTATKTATATKTWTSAVTIYYTKTTTYTQTRTFTSTATVTNTATKTATRTNTRTATLTHTKTETKTATASATSTTTHTCTAVPTIVYSGSSNGAILASGVMIDQNGNLVYPLWVSGYGLIKDHTLLIPHSAGQYTVIKYVSFSCATANKMVWIEDRLGNLMGVRYLCFGYPGTVIPAEPNFEMSLPSPLIVGEQYDSQVYLRIADISSGVTGTATVSYNIGYFYR